MSNERDRSPGISTTLTALLLAISFILNVVLLQSWSSASKTSDFHRVYLKYVLQKDKVLTVRSWP